MSTDKPLSYLCAKEVIPFLEFNLRLSLSRRCPLFPKIHKSTVLSVDHLCITPHEIRINDASYRLGVIQIYKNDKTPGPIQQMNSDGGLPYDVDRYGLQDGSVFGNNYYQTFFKQRWQNSDLSRLEVSKEYLEAKIRTIPLKNRTAKLKILEEKIADIKCMSLPYDLQYSKSEPPYKHFMQLMITCKYGSSVEKMTYQKSLQHAVLYMFGKFFGDRRVYIRELKAEFNVKEILDLVRPIMVRGISCLDVNRILEHDPILISVPQLTASNVLVTDVLRLADNDRIHFQGLDYGHNGGTRIIEFCQDREVESLKHFSMRMKCRTRAIETFDHFFESAEGYIGEIPETRGTYFPLCITFPKTDQLEINVYLQQFEKPLEYGGVPTDVYEFHVKINRKGYCEEMGDIKRPQKQRKVESPYEDHILEENNGLNNFCLLFLAVFIVLLIIAVIGLVYHFTQ